MRFKVSKKKKERIKKMNKKAELSSKLDIELLKKNFKNYHKHYFVPFYLNHNKKSQKFCFLELWLELDKNVYRCIEVDCLIENNELKIDEILFLDVDYNTSSKRNDKNNEDYKKIVDLIENKNLIVVAEKE